MRELTRSQWQIRSKSRRPNFWAFSAGVGEYQYTPVRQKTHTSAWGPVEGFSGREWRVSLTVWKWSWDVTITHWRYAPCVS